MSKGHPKFFPGKLRNMLDQVDGLGLSHGSSWVSEGRAFAIHDPDVFMDEVAPHFFDKQTRLRSFHRQLSIWGFTRLETGAGGRGVWFHKNFIRDKPELIKHIKRVPVKNPKSTLPAPKNQIPDYTNYRMPGPFQNNPLNARGPSAVVPKIISSAPNTLQNAHSAAVSGRPENSTVAQEIHPSTESYLSALGRMPPSLIPGYAPSHNTALPLYANSAPPVASTMPIYQPTVVTSMNCMPGQAAGIAAVPPANDLGNVAQQLLACRNHAPAQNSLGDGGNNLNSAILAMILESRRQRILTTNTNGGGLDNQELLSSISRRNMFERPNSS